MRASWPEAVDRPLKEYTRLTPVLSKLRNVYIHSNGDDLASHGWTACPWTGARYQNVNRITTMVCSFPKLPWKLIIRKCEYSHMEAYPYGSLSWKMFCYRKISSILSIRIHSSYYGF